MSLPYNPSDPLSIETYGKRLVGHPIKDFIDVNSAGGGGKGYFGSYVEYYFGIPSNSISGADFSTIGGANVELKTSPLIYLKKGELRVKERLIFNIINYNNICKEQWESSTFLNKNRLMLWVAYLYDPNVNPCDYIVQHVRLINLENLPEADYSMMKHDWETIVGYVAGGTAELLSEGLTNYLGACTKGSTAAKSMREQPYSDVPARQRAFSWKQSYLNSVLPFLMENNPQPNFAPYLVPTGSVDNKQVGIFKTSFEPSLYANNTLEQLVEQRFLPYMGKSVSELSNIFNLDISPTAKNYVAALSKKILGIADGFDIPEFAKANIAIKTIRLKIDGHMKESMSFKAFKYTEIINEEWETSTLKEDFERKFFFVIFQFNKEKTELFLRKVMFWSMPGCDLENEVRPVWERAIQCIKAGQYNSFPRQSESRICHVRPHGQNNNDRYPTPQGGAEPKKCFWLNRTYVEDIIDAKHLANAK